VLDDLDHAVPVARALVAGGLPVIELTLRTPVALDAIAAIAAEVPEILVGAGTITSPELVGRAVEAGAQFLVSPGTTPTLLQELGRSGVPFLPGTATVSEAMAVLEAGFTEMKFFPAEASGGAPALKAIGAPLPQITFCPTGGVSPDNALSYLSLANVACAGGSWVAPEDAVERGDWARIQKLASDAATLGK
jgi:2-dehydro-3-deoxyphosphogluconate aldolase/(4S)-4-hydroxy-2-oxoglutarate aldolase